MYVCMNVREERRRGGRRRSGRWDAFKTRTHTSESGGKKLGFTKENEAHKVGTAAGLFASTQKLPLEWAPVWERKM